jgi:tRNA(fMet)-specific endonuclease VapC
MRYLIDTNILSFAMRKRFDVEARLQGIAKSSLLLSAIVYAEGMAGAYRAANPPALIKLWRSYIDGWEMVAFDAACADHYGRIRADLERRGTMIGHRDCQIAATALAYAQTEGETVTVVTDNVDEFKRVAGLKVANWVKR